MSSVAKNTQLTFKWNTRLNSAISYEDRIKKYKLPYYRKSSAVHWDEAKGGDIAKILGQERPASQNHSII